MSVLSRHVPVGRAIWSQGESRHSLVPGTFIYAMNDGGHTMKSYTQFAIVASLMLCGCQAANELFDGRLNDLTSSGTAQPTKIGCAPADEQDTDGFFASALEIDQQDENVPRAQCCLRSDSVIPSICEPAGVVAGLKVTTVLESL